ncbi:MAG TPA: tetratricopeptide repeat protein [Kofleriaceae bacterium]
MSHDQDIDDDQLSALAKQLDAPAPDEQRVEAMRGSLLRAAAEDRREEKPRWPFVAGGFSAGAFAAAATVMMVFHFSHGAGKPIAVDRDEHRAQIEASSAADFERQVTHGANGTDEVVRLHAGRISVAVAALPHGDRVRVAAKDGELEGEGTYEIAVDKDVIREVWVRAGSAHLRILGQQEVFLAQGQSWKAPVITADLQTQTQTQITKAITTPTPTSAHAPTAAPTTTSALTPTSAVATTSAVAPRLITASTSASPSPSKQSPTPTHVDNSTPRLTSTTETDAAKPEVPALHTMADASPNEAPPNAIAQLDKAKPVTTWQLHFSTGWQLLRAGKSAEAARELAAAADAGGDDPLAGDARYFEAIALTKAGRKTEAEHALVAFLDRSPHALRRGRAAVMLGRLIAERGDTAAARTWFDSATHDADPDVAAAAKAGLTGLP